MICCHLHLNELFKVPIILIGAPLINSTALSSPEYFTSFFNTLKSEWGQKALIVRCTWSTINLYWVLRHDSSYVSSDPFRLIIFESNQTYFMLGLMVTKTKIDLTLLLWKGVLRIDIFHLFALLISLLWKWTFWVPSEPNYYMLGVKTIQVEPQWSFLSPFWNLSYSKGPQILFKILLLFASLFLQSRA